MTSKASPSLAEEWIPRLQLTAKLSHLAYKGIHRLYVGLYDGFHRQCKVRLSKMDTAVRLDEIVAATPEKVAALQMVERATAGKKGDGGDGGHRACRLEARDDARQECLRPPLQYAGADARSCD